jgi:hypothetical protein
MRHQLAQRPALPGVEAVHALIRETHKRSSRILRENGICTE